MSAAAQARGAPSAQAVSLARAMASFPRFCALLEYVDFDAGVRMPMRLTGIQRAYCAARTHFDIILKARKVYMTSLECARDVWWFLRRKGAHVLIVVPSEKDHALQLVVSRMIAVYFESLRRFFPDLELDKETDTEWVRGDCTLRIMEAGASLRTATKGGRGGGYNRIHLSEVAFYEHPGETLNTLINAMPRKGRTEVVIESTPNGAVGWYYDTWRAACLPDDDPNKNAYTPHFFPWYLHEAYRQVVPPGTVITPANEVEVALVAKGVTGEQLAWYRETLRRNPDKLKVQQEFPNDPESCFLDAAMQYLPTAAIEYAVNADMPLIEGVAYAGLDIGRHNDLTVLVVVKQDRYGNVYHQETRWCRRTDYDEQLEMIAQSAADWEWRRLCVDATGLGSYPAEVLQKMMGRHRIEPVDFTLQRKAEIAGGLYHRLAGRTLQILNDPELVRDLKSIRRVITSVGNVTYDAPRTREGHADRAWALGLAVRACSPLLEQGGRTDTGYGDYARSA